jgi:hypothetical protein
VAWTVLPTYSDGNVLTAAQLNAIAANINETFTAKATAAGQYAASTAANTLAARAASGVGVATVDTVTSTTYGAGVSTSGPATAALATGSSACVSISARLQHATATAESWASFAISGATTLAASDNFALMYNSPLANSAIRAGSVLIVNGMTVGNNTFTMQYRTSTSAGGGTTMSNRQIAVHPY